MIIDILILIGLTIIPLVELRLAIPAGILSGTLHLPFNLTVTGLGLSPLIVFPIVIITNFLMGLLVFNLLRNLDFILRKSFIGKYYGKTLDHTRKQIHPYVEKYGVVGAVIFIGIPLPGSGVYTGSIGSFVLGLSRKEFYKASALGILIAGTIVTGLTISGMAIFG